MPHLFRVTHLRFPAAFVGLLLTGCILFGARVIDIRLQPAVAPLPRHLQPLAVYVVPQSRWQARGCSIGTQVADCRALRYRTPLSWTERSASQQVTVTAEAHVLVQTCAGVIARVDPIQPEKGANDVFPVGCS